MGLIITNIQLNRLVKQLNENSDSWGEFNDITITKKMSVEETELWLLKQKQACESDEGRKKNNNIPFVHKNNIKRHFDNEDGTIDMEKFIEDITEIPSDIFSTSRKMELTSTDEEEFIDISIPALRGLVYNKRDGFFYFVNTCPGAGKCTLFCYALQGNYIRFHGVQLKQTRVLNLLLNEPDLFEDLLFSEIILQAARKRNKIVGLRWNNAGDFFSKKYYQIAKNVTRRLKKRGFKVVSYGYTKMADFVVDDDDIIMNFSDDANKKETDKIKGRKNVKIGKVVPKELFSDLFFKKGKGFEKDENGRYIFREPAEEKKQILKQRLSDEYNVPLETLLFYGEYLKLKERGQDYEYNVIVMAGDGDITASRKDVRYTFNLIHN